MSAARILIATGATLMAAGLLWAAVSRVPGLDRLGRLPGDLHVEGKNFSLHFPWVTCLFLSQLLSAVMRLWSRWH